MKTSKKNLQIGMSKFILTPLLIATASIFMTSCTTESLDSTELESSDTAASFYNADPGEGLFYIKNKLSGHYLNYEVDTNGGNVFGGDKSTQVWQLIEAGTAPNGHQLYYIKANRTSGTKLLDVAGRSTANRANATIYDFQASNNNNQRWYFKRDSDYNKSNTYMIFSFNGGKCLDETLDSGSDNVYMYKNTGDDNNNQRWALISYSNN